MINTEKILKFTKENNGIITSAQATKLGIGREYLRILLKKGLLERSERGIYILPTIFDDEMFNLQNRFKKGIFSHETALFLLNLTDHTPVEYSMTFPTGYNVLSLQNKNVKRYLAQKELYRMGVITTQSSFGNDIEIYNSERTLCDILKPRAHIDIQIISNAFKIYTRSNQRNIPLLSEYAKIWKVDRKVSAYLEVLL